MTSDTIRVMLQRESIENVVTFHQPPPLTVSTKPIHADGMLMAVVSRMSFLIMMMDNQVF